MLVLLLTLFALIAEGKQKIEVCRPKDRRNHFLVATAPTVPYASAKKVCETIHGRQLAKLTKPKLKAKGA